MARFSLCTLLLVATTAVAALGRRLAGNSDGTPHIADPADDGHLMVTSGDIHLGPWDDSIMAMTGRGSVIPTISKPSGTDRWFCGVVS